jgi:6-phosphogluconolactonase (cycloisomerase 2 family)
MAFVQNGAFLLVAEDVTANFPVDVFSVDVVSGAIVRLSSVLNLTGTRFLAAHPNGRLVYAVGTSSVTPLSIDANGVVTTGTTTQIPGFTATAATVDKAGANLFVTGVNGAVASFAINATNSTLTTNNIATATVNFNPVCVVAK